MSTATFAYNRPGVYIKESLLPLPAPTTAPGTAVAAFIGTHNAGPTKPTKVSSWAQFAALYGGFGSGLDYLPFQVYQFFSNGGQAAWILRATAADSVAASTTLDNVPTPPAPTLTASPAGTAPTGTGAAPTSAVTGVTLTTVTAPQINPEQTGLSVTWAAYTPTADVDAYEVTLTPPSDTGITQTVWIPQPATGNPVATFEGLLPGTTYSVQIVPYKGTSAGPPLATPATFSTAAEYPEVPALTITSLGTGAYGNSLYIDITPSWTSGRFHLLIRSGSTATGSLVETWQDVSLNPADPRYVVSLVNAPLSGSNYIRVTNDLPPATASTGTGQTPDASWYPEAVSGQPLSGGSDGVQVVNLAQALTSGFASISDVLLINLCGNTGMVNGIPPLATVASALNWVSGRGGAFLLLDAPSAPAPADSTAATQAYTQLLPAASPPGSYQPATSYAAMYGPWIQVTDPAGSSISSTRSLAPAGSVLGQYSLADAAVGPNRAAAGASYPLVGVVGVEHNFTTDQLDTLNVAGFNVIRAMPQVGFCIMGARTLKPGMPDRYISVRRMLIYLEDLLTQVTKFAVFEPNGPALWQTLSAIVTQQLTIVMQAGQLQANTPDQAFFVICDETNNTPQTVALGEVHIQAGVALSSPAEFVVLNISQYQGGVSASSNSLATAVTS